LEIEKKLKVDWRYAWDDSILIFNISEWKVIRRVESKLPIFNSRVLFHRVVEGEKKISSRKSRREKKVFFFMIRIFHKLCIASFIRYAVKGKKEDIILWKERKDLLSNDVVDVIERNEQTSTDDKVWIKLWLLTQRLWMKFDVKKYVYDDMNLSRRDVNNWF
jgi:hypothetical protein